MSLVSDEFIRALGLTILDSLWQGAALLLLCTVLFWSLKSRSARLRYRIALLALLALPTLGIITFAGHYQSVSGSLDILGVLATEPLANLTLEPLAAIEDLSMLERWQVWALENASWVALLWAVGLAVFTTRLLGGFYMVRSLKSSACNPQGSQWTQRLATLCQSLELKVPVALKESVKVSSPIVLGYLKPVIIFPMGLLQGMPTDQVEAVLLHELAHIRRHDYLINLLVSLLQVFYFYHPAYWWLQQQLDTEREYSCDDLVLQNTSGLSLVKALAAVKEFQVNGYGPSLAFTGHKNQLLKRVERIMKKKTRTNWLGALISMSALMLSFFLMSYRSVTLEESHDFEEQPVVEDALETPALMSLQHRDSLKLEQAVMQLLNGQDSNLILELDDKGRLVDMTRNGEPIGQAELKIFKQAHAKLRNYAYTGSAAEKERRAQELYEMEARYAKALKQYNEEQNALLRMLNEQNASLSKAEREQTQKNYELMKREYEMLQKQSQSVSQQLTTIDLGKIDSLNIGYTQLELDRQVLLNRRLQKLLDAYSDLDIRFNEEKEIRIDALDSMINLRSGAEKERLVYFKTRVQQLLENVNAMKAERQAQQMRENELMLNEYKKLMYSLRERGVYGNRKIEYSSAEGIQKEAVELLAKQAKSVDVPLIVVDGEIKENWGVVDLDELERTKMIKSVNIIRASQVTEFGLKPYLKGRDVLIQVTTAPGNKDFVRASIAQADSGMDEMTQSEKKEQLSKAMIERMKVEGLVPEGELNLSLSVKAMTINGEKQPRKVLKRYLKLYENTMGKSLAKNETFALQK